MHRIIDVNKIDVGIAPASVDGAETGQYFGMSLHRQALFIATTGIMAAGATVALQLLQARDADGTDSKDIDGYSATITANTSVNSVDLTIQSDGAGVHVAGQTVTINGLVFTAAAADDPDTREYAVGSTGAESAANLLAKINSTNENIGVPGVSGVSNVVTTNTVLTLTADEPGDTTITAEASDSTTVVSTVSSIAYLEVDSAFLDINNGFTHVAIKATTSTAILTGVTLVRDGSRYLPNQNVAAGGASFDN